MSTVSRVPPSRRRPRRGSRTPATVAGSSAPAQEHHLHPPSRERRRPQHRRARGQAAGGQILGQLGGVPALDQEPRHPAGRRVPELLALGPLRLVEALGLASRDGHERGMLRQQGLEPHAAARLDGLGQAPSELEGPLGRAEVGQVERRVGEHEGADRDRRLLRQTERHGRAHEDPRRARLERRPRRLGVGRGDRRVVSHDLRLGERLPGLRLEPLRAPAERAGAAGRGSARRGSPPAPGARRAGTRAPASPDGRGAPGGSARSAARSRSPRRSGVRAKPSRLRTRSTERPRASAARAASRSPGERLAAAASSAPSATRSTAGHAPRAPGSHASAPRAGRPPSSRGSARGSRGGSRRPRAGTRSRTRSRACQRGASGDLCAGSSSSTTTARPSGASGSHAAVRVPTASRACPWRHAHHAAQRSRGEAALVTSRAGSPRRVSSRAAQARASSISGARTRTLPPVASVSPIRRSTRSPRSRPVTSSAGPGGQAGGNGASAAGAPERMPGGSARNAASPQRARRLRRRPARELEQRRGQRRHGIEDGRQRLESLVPWAPAGLDRDHDPRTGTAAKGNAHALPRGDALLQLGRNAIREGAGNGKVGDDVREQEARPQAPAGAWPRTRSYSRRMSLRSSQALRR